MFQIRAWIYLILCIFATLRLSGWAYRRDALSNFCSLHTGKRVPIAGIWESGRLTNPTVGSLSLVRPLLLSKSAFKFGDGTRVKGEGTIRCLPFYRNPSFKQDGLIFFSEKRIKVKPIALFEERKTWTAEIKNKLRKRLPPLLYGLVIAVWTADTRLLPLSLHTFYEQAGLLAILALSGQHVSILSLVLRFPCVLMLWFCRRYFRFQAKLLNLNSFTPLLAAVVLFFTSNGSPPLVRSAVMVVFFSLLRTFKRECSLIQLIASSAAFLILFDPALIANKGFLLSVAAMVLLSQIPKLSTKNLMKNYFYLNLAMPILFFPVSCFFFGKISWLSPLFLIALCWLWEFFVIPAGFLLPLILLIPEGMDQVLGWFFDKVWKGFVVAHYPVIDDIGLSYASIPRFTVLEGLLIQSVILVIFLTAHGAIIRRSKRAV